MAVKDTGTTREVEESTNRAATDHRDQVQQQSDGPKRPRGGGHGGKGATSSVPLGTIFPKN